MSFDAILTVGCDGISSSSVSSVSDIHNLTDTHLDHITPVETVSNTDSNETYNNGDDCNVNSAVLSVIEWISEQIAAPGNDSSAICFDTGKETCTKNDPVLNEYRNVELKTELECSMMDLNKSSSRIDEKGINSVIENCAKENLMSVLKLSPVSKNNVEHVCSKKIQGKVKETVYFTSPIATVYEFSGISQAVSEDNTVTLSQCSSDDLPASQNTFSNICRHDDDQIDVTSFLKLDREVKTNENEMELILSAHGFYQSSCNKNSDFIAEGGRNVNLNTVDTIAVDSYLSNESEEINSQHDHSAIVVEQQHCGKEDGSVEDACNENVPEVSEIQLACKVNNVDDRDYINSSYNNEDQELDFTETSKNQSFVDTVQDQTSSETIYFALPKDDCTITKIDEFSSLTEKTLQVDEMENFRNESSDFDKVQFDRFTGNEIFKKEALTTQKETDNVELSLNNQTTKQCHDVKVNDQYTCPDESLSNFQNYQFDHSAAKINLIMESIHGVDNDEDLPQVTDIETGEEDGSSFNGSDSFVDREKIDGVNASNKNSLAAGEFTKCKGDKIEPVFFAGKRELSIEPFEFIDTKTHKSKHSTGAQNQRKRKLTDKYLENTEKSRRIHNNKEFVENFSGLHIPNTLKLLCTEKLAFMDEDIVWQYQNNNINLLRDKTKSEYSNKQELQDEEMQKAMPVNKSDLTIRDEDCNTVQDTENDNFNEQCLTIVSDDAESPDISDIDTNNVTYKVNETGHYDSGTGYNTEEDIGLINTVNDEIVASCRFITATEYLSQSSQNSGSTGFVYDAPGNMADTCLSQPDMGANDTSVPQESKPNKQGFSEIDELLVITEEKEHKTVTLYEIDELELNKEKVMVTSDMVFGRACENTNISRMKVANDEDEQIDTALLDMYVDKVVDQMVPNFENDKLYACNADICDNQDTSICKPMENFKRKGQQCFKRKYTPSCDSDLPSPELPDEDFVVRITPLKTCGKPLRLGLSKRQPMRKSLHKIFRH